MIQGRRTYNLASCLMGPSPAWRGLALRSADTGGRWGPREAACRVPVGALLSWRVASDAVTGAVRAIPRVPGNPPGSIECSDSVRGEIQRPDGGHPRRPGPNGAMVTERPSGELAGSRHARRKWPWPGSEVSW
jgi:hypothetical protein